MSAREGYNWTGVFLAALLLLAGCATGPPESPLPETITEDFFPLVIGSWWEFEYFLPGFPDRPQTVRFLLQAADEKGQHPVLVKTPAVRSRGNLALGKREGVLRMTADGEPVDILVFGARVGDTWAYQPDKPHYRARLAEIRYERILGDWRPVARVTLHAGGVDTEIVKKYCFSPGLGWVRLMQSRAMGSQEEFILRNVRIPEAPPPQR